MKITWLGQAGLLFEKDHFKIMIDPYLSDSVKKINPNNYRRVEICDTFFEIKPDVMIFTHMHQDHYDPETVSKFITETTNITVLSPFSVWDDVRKIGGSNNYVEFDRHTTWTEQDIRFTAVKARHSDAYAIGVVIDDGENKYYVTGDTLYNEEIFADIPDDIYAIFLPVNGVGNNMNMIDAKIFCERIKPKYATPLHCGMFDEIDMTKWDYERKVVPQIYKEVKLI